MRHESQEPRPRGRRGDEGRAGDGRSPPPCAPTTNHFRAAVENLIDGKNVAATETRIAEYQHQQRQTALAGPAAASPEGAVAAARAVTATAAQAAAPTTAPGARTNRERAFLLQDLVEGAPPAARLRRAWQAGGWDEGAAERALETEFLTSLLV